MNKNKKWFKSKTLWINILLLIGGIATAIGMELQTGLIVSVPALLNIFMRVISKTQIKW